MNLYWEIDAQRLVSGLDDGTEPGYLVFPARDVIPIRLFVVERDSIEDSFVATTLGSGETITFQGKATPASASELWNTAGASWEQDADDLAYEGTLDLNTDALVAAIASLANKMVYGEICMLKSSRHRYSTRFLVQVRNDVIRDDTVTPAATDKWKTIDGVLHLYNADQDKWIPVKSRGAAGQESVELGPGVTA